MQGQWCRRETVGRSSGARRAPNGRPWQDRPLEDARGGSDGGPPAPPALTAKLRWDAMRCRPLSPRPSGSRKLERADSQAHGWAGRVGFRKGSVCTGQSVPRGLWRALLWGRGRHLCPAVSHTCWHLRPLQWSARHLPRLQGSAWSSPPGQASPDARGWGRCLLWVPMVSCTSPKLALITLGDLPS